MDLRLHPIFIVDDDLDDEDIILDAMKDLGFQNEVRFFHTAQELLTELKDGTIHPFMIISDINLPKMNGLQLREEVLKNGTTAQSVPFLFWSTSASEEQIIKAYELSAHGFFIKGKSYQELKDGLKEIVQYWTRSLAPSNS